MKHHHHGMWFLFRFRETDNISTVALVPFAITPRHCDDNTLPESIFNHRKAHRLPPDIEKQRRSESLRFLVRSYSAQLPRLSRRKNNRFGSAVRVFLTLS